MAAYALFRRRLNTRRESPSCWNCNRNPAVQLAEALAVLGSGRIYLRDAADVAGLQVSGAAVQDLIDVGLVVLDDSDGAAMLRWSHGLASSAVYQQLSLRRRRELHARAAQVLTVPTTVFEHRLGAAEPVDEQLATDLDEAATRLHEQHSYRMAAQYLRWAAEASGTREERQRRWLDAAFSAVLAQNRTELHHDRAAIVETSDPIRRGLVLGALECFSGHYCDGADLLAEAATHPVDTADPLPRYHLEILLARARTILGHDLDLIRAGLQRAQSLSVTDPAMTSYRLQAEAHVAGRTGSWPGFVAMLDRLPQAASATPAELSGLLIWRAQGFLETGFLGAATEDLRELQRRQHDGVVDVLSNGFDSILSTTHWAAGRWDLAKVGFRAAMDAPVEQIGLLTSATTSSAWSASGDFEEADRQLDEAAQVLDQRPWQEAVELLLVAQTVRRHTGGSPAAQATLIAETRQRWPNTQIGSGFMSGFWAMHFALAQLWAGESDNAEYQLRRATTATPDGPALSAAAAWVRTPGREARTVGAGAGAPTGSNIYSRG